MVLVCGMLEDNGRIIFLIRKNINGTEQLELPCFETRGSVDFVSMLASEFRRQTAIDAEVLGIKHKCEYNAGSRKKKRYQPAIIFEVKAKNKTARPNQEFSGFRWLSLENALNQRLGRKFEWLKRLDDKEIGNQ